jgi:hypothetical protein
VRTLPVGSAGETRTLKAAADAGGPFSLRVEVAGSAGNGGGRTASRHDRVVTCHPSVPVVPTHGLKRPASSAPASRMVCRARMARCVLVPSVPPCVYARYVQTRATAGRDGLGTTIHGARFSGSASASVRR